MILKLKNNVKESLEKNLSQYLQEELINEATVSDMAEEPVTPEGETVEEVLEELSVGAEDFYDSLADIVQNGDDIDKHAVLKATNAFNPIFVGPTGAGKTSKIISWANKKGIEVVTINMMGDALDFLGVKTIERDHELVVDDNGTTKKTPRVHTIATQAFDTFLTGKQKILFLDEINKTNPIILQALYDLISFHTVQNGDDVMYLNKLLFTIGAMNPSEYGGGREQLDPALEARMIIYNVGYETDVWVKHEQEYFGAFANSAKRQLLAAKDKTLDSDSLQVLERRYAAAQGRLDLVNKLAENQSKIQWSDAGTIANKLECEGVLVPRTLEAAISLCDGTYSSFIKKAGRKCGMKNLLCLESIFKGYTDKEHKANEIWGKDYTPKSKEQEEEEQREKERKENENKIIDGMTEEEKKEAELNQNLFDKLSKSRG